MYILNRINNNDNNDDLTKLSKLKAGYSKKGGRGIREIMVEIEWVNREREREREREMI